MIPIPSALLMKIVGGVGVLLALWFLYHEVTEHYIDIGRIDANPVAGVEYLKEHGSDRLVTHAELISFCRFAIDNGHHAQDSSANSKKDTNLYR